MVLEDMRMLGLLASRRRRLLALGLSTALAGILLVASFQFVDDHRWFWNIAPFVCVGVFLATMFGGTLVGLALARTQHTRLWIVAVGAVLGLVWMATGILAAVLSTWSMFNLPGVEEHVGFATYPDSFLFSGAHIRFLQTTAGTGFIGGVAVGLGLAWKRVSGLLEASG